jgi:hypothetical protein
MELCTVTEGFQANEGFFRSPFHIYGELSWQATALANSTDF